MDELNKWPSDQDVGSGGDISSIILISHCRFCIVTPDSNDGPLGLPLTDLTHKQKTVTVQYAIIEVIEANRHKIIYTKKKIIKNNSDFNV